MHEDLHDEKLQELRKSLESDEIFENLALLFAAFSDSTRLKILSALSKEELCVHELSQILNIKELIKRIIPIQIFRSIPSQIFIIH